MQPITKKALAILGVILVLLLALGALPGFLKSGDPYYLTVEPTDRTLASENATMPVAENLSDRTYRYTWQALRDAGASEDGSGRSSAYWKGYVGFKEAFTHSPFDEIDAYRTSYASAFVGEDSLLISYENQTYRLAVTGG